MATSSYPPRFLLSDVRDNRTYKKRCELVGAWYFLEAGMMLNNSLPSQCPLFGINATDLIEVR